jgi:hypothetical protein
MLLPIMGIAQAGADYAPQPNDIVGVGGDTPQFAVDFGLNGDTAGAAGFNSTATVNRVVDFDATADGNARTAYTQGSSEKTPSLLNPTDVLRAGTSPVQRISSSGNAITALLADQGSPETINYIFSGSLPTAAQQSTAGTEGFGYLHVVELGTDAVEIAAANGTVGSTTYTTNAPAGLTINQLLSIYDSTTPVTWAGLGLGASTDTIIPELPPTTSTIYKTFIADLKTANGNVAATLTNPDIVQVEQNDPTGITGVTAPTGVTESSPAPDDAIVPFSAARLALWNSSYFLNPATQPSYPTGGPAALAPAVSLLTGTVVGSGTAYTSPITDYVIFRQSDAASTTPLEPGGTKNWVQSLFSNPSAPTTPFFARSTGAALVAASGVVPAYNDLGNVSHG